LNKPLLQEQEFYNQRWERDQLPLSQQERIGQIVAAIPPACKRVLDVGSGDGRVSYEARRGSDRFVVAFDLSTVALARASNPRCCGSAGQLPFPDRSFDLVVATEILEHLPDALHAAAINELGRVANKYILISVPNRENLEEVSTRCADCGAHFHVWGHKRSYSADLVGKLFADFGTVKILPFGEATESYNRLLLWIRHKVAGAWYWEERAVCYACRSTTRPQSRWPFLARLCDFLNARFWAPHAKRAGWILGLYARQSA
jgi:SAM-dependent methyltransferase